MNLEQQLTDYEATDAMQFDFDEFQIPYQRCYDLNLLPGSELDEDCFGFTELSPFAPITPDTRQKQMGSQWVTTKETPESQRNEDGDMLLNIGDFTSSAVSTQKKHLVSEVGDELVINLNKTPKQKTPARRNKHRPKVIKEGKPIKTPSPKNTPPSENRIKRKYVRRKGINVSGSPQENGVEASPGKRKYVRKKGLNNSHNQQKTILEETTVPVLKTPAKSCRKKLNFDTERTTGIDLNADPEDVEEERGISSIPKNNIDERRGIKRRCFEQINPRNLNSMGSLQMCQEFFIEAKLKILESRKKTKEQSDLQTLQLLNSCTGRIGTSDRVNGLHFQLPMAAAVTHNLQKHSVSAQGHGAPVTTMISWDRPPTTPQKDEFGSAGGSYSSNQWSSEADKMLLQLRKDASEVHQQSFPKPKGAPRKKKVGVSVEDITRILEGLCIYDKNDKERKALVPFRGNNAIIPYEPIKKRKARPKVDLDPETDRLWKLLTGKEGSEANETLDKDKEKWWEDERRVFRGRADSFIARMHCVQGDRRFSRWKGSVVDSVIGVFLTQNVSDHLSSSAFMSLAAKFSLKSSKTHEIYSQNGACVLVEEPIETLSPNNFMQYQDKITRQPVFNQSFFRSCESSDHMRRIHTSSIKPAVHQPTRTSEVILSQAYDSSTIEIVDETRPNSGSNSEPEDHTKGFESSEKPHRRNPVQTVTRFEELFGHDNSRSQYMHYLPKTHACEIRNPVIDGFNKMNSASRFTPVNSSIHRVQETLVPSSWVQTNMRTEACHASNVTFGQNKMPSYQVPSQGQYDFLGNDRHVREKNETKNSAQKQDACTEGRVSVVDKQNCFENTVAQSNSKEQNCVSNARKGTTEDEKKKEFDWDSLRRQALLNCEKKERSEDAKDSLDYEVLRGAHVNEISDAIRERGMNNLLADRIKGFLDRLVTDHGSIDLEWLRDVPPDKAKDYLLSIRGLGLKSVECVRLLTLRHLAFPVDTNVGRIAVRLGWVPLQPLPESLQLHLLEMYPVLESIQKYIWPRLCKLDQLKLYELHYQMITFGKVFCTKSKPNCNACPMRAECRHFASAFASARLALPGPEEKRIVPSDAPNAADTNPPVINRPMLLPPAENSCNKDARPFRSEREPIIEEPTTPEPEVAELSLSDIEDQYYDDADEIPTIKLDMDEFTMNLHKMQDNMEIQGDMSKALVALNPLAASIPTPKLKNVSRLRTEHQVYELPDAHRLLEGLDRREADDPSPYLLAIWTPGETANSMQPPERGCEAQESGTLCDRSTCFSCNCIKEENSQVVRGTILVPCRTAMRGSFPLNGTYFQVNEMFADHASSLNPINVPRAWIWNLRRRTVYFGTSVTTIFKGMTTQEIQQCFCGGYVCVRGFDQKSRAPKPLIARLHFPASRLVKTKKE